MAATYDPALPTDLDWIRFQIGDTSSPFRLPNETIDAVLVEESNKWLAAARCGNLALAAASGGLSSKSVDGLSISWGGTEDTYRSHLSWLQAEGVRQSMTAQGKSHVFNIF